MERLTLGLLHPSAVLPTCLDDQWIDRHGLFYRGEFSATQLDRKAENELKLCLLSAQQIVINRAFLVNSNVLWNLWEHDLHRTGMDELLGDGTLVPFLFRDIDAGLTSAEETLELKKERIANWRKKASAINVKCLRFSWDSENENSLKCASLLEQRFDDRLRKLTVPETAEILPNFKNPSVDHDWCNEEGFSEFLASEFSEVLKVCRDGNPGEIVYRGALYQKLGLAREGIGNAAQPFRKEIKQIIDLIYNSNLSDALDIIPVTPTNSATRADLSESTTNAPQLTVQQVAKLIVEIGRLHKSWGKSGVMPEFVPSALSVDQISEIRSKGPWKSYVNIGVELAKPLDGAEAADPVEAMVERLKLAEENANDLRKMLIKDYANAKLWRKGKTGVAYDFSATIGSDKIGSLIGAGLGFTVAGPIGAAAGPVIEMGARQAVDWSVKVGRLGLAALRFPRFELEDREVKARDIVDCLPRGSAHNDTGRVELGTADSGHILDGTPDYG